ncbi:transposase [Rhizobium tibeticum]|nr:transposase [Rhizobium tibeticum]
MSEYAGIDVSLEYSSVCVVDADGRIVREAKVLSEPDALIAWFGEHGVAMERIGLEAGPLSQWLHAGMTEAGLAVELIETRHVRAAFKTMPVKTDKKDARGIAQLMRLGWFRPVHCKSLPAQEVRALLTARKLIQGKMIVRPSRTKNYLGWKDQGTTGNSSRDASTVHHDTKRASAAVHS